MHLISSVALAKLLHKSSYLFPIYLTLDEKHYWWYPRKSFFQNPKSSHSSSESQNHISLFKHSKAKQSWTRTYFWRRKTTTVTGVLRILANTRIKKHKTVNHPKMNFSRNSWSENGTICDGSHRAAAGRTDQPKTEIATPMKLWPTKSQSTTEPPKARE